MQCIMQIYRKNTIAIWSVVTAVISFFNGLLKLKFFKNFIFFELSLTVHTQGPAVDFP